MELKESNYYQHIQKLITHVPAHERTDRAILNEALSLLYWACVHSNDKEQIGSKTDSEKFIRFSTPMLNKLYSWKNVEFFPGDIVESVYPDSQPLRSGSEWYANAIVVQSSPLVLVSEGADMRWQSTVLSMKLKRIGRATDKQLAICMERLES